MKKRNLVIGAGVLLLLLTGVFAVKPRETTAQSINIAFSSPINGGCYIAAPNQCKIHLDPFIINMENAYGKALERFVLYANGIPIYDFRTDVSNPPYSFSPSPVALDFAATCGETYTINMEVKTQDYPNFLNAGLIENVTCPSVVP